MDVKKYNGTARFDKKNRMRLTQFYIFLNRHVRAMRFLTQNSCLPASLAGGRRNDTIELVHNNFFLHNLLIIPQPPYPQIHQRRFDHRHE